MAGVGREEGDEQGGSGGEVHQTSGGTEEQVSVTVAHRVPE